MTAATGEHLSDAASQRERRAPDFVVVGQPKSGTTALHQMLGQHPEIFMSSPKEPNFFATDFRLRFHPRRSGPEVIDPEDYEALFAAANAHQKTGEASTFYVLSELAAQNLAAWRPDARIVVLFRGAGCVPVGSAPAASSDARRECTVSEAGVGSRGPSARGPSGAEALAQPAAAPVLEHVRYTEQLRRFHAQFPRSR